MSADEKANYEAEQIRWVDAVGTSSWRSIESVKRDEITEVDTLGFVIAEDEKCVVIAQSLDLDNENVTHVMVIPQVCIVGRWRIR